MNPEVSPEVQSTLVVVEGGAGEGHGGEDGVHNSMGAHSSSNNGSSDRDLSSDLLVVDAFTSTAPLAASPTIGIGKYEGHTNNTGTHVDGQHAAVAVPLPMPVAPVVGDLGGPNLHNSANTVVAEAHTNQQSVVGADGSGGGGGSHHDAANNPDAIWEPLPFDILWGRGAKVNLHPGNAKFRAL